mmetsp:Transcript_26840/g.55989  ORF Transcript_26840/g.55989 Transcript_26840/m.55989 type:complete len:93 (+) Transcript_26840:1296-1574(+)
MAPASMTVRSSPAASPADMAEAQLLSNAAGSDVEGARTRMSRGSASSEMLTRVEDGWGGDSNDVAIFAGVYISESLRRLKRIQEVFLLYLQQ